MAPKVLSTAEEVWTYRKQQRGRLALVPTMGFLHEGHLTLMRKAREHADQVAVSIFVNPTQFGPKEDLSRYPRDLDGDLAKCGQAGVDVVYAPAAEDLYPPGHQTWVEVSEVSRRWCGEKRPGHFRGVATVVTKLFAVFRPDVALFGEKDYQQLLVLKALARDLKLGVEVIGVPTVREPDGLALSSRNTYLSAAERKRALALSRALALAARRVQAGETSGERLIEAMREELVRSEVREDYVAVVDAHTLEPLPTLVPGRAARALLAGFVGTTRLIDNAPLGG